MPCVAPMPHFPHCLGRWGVADPPLFQWEHRVAMAVGVWRSKGLGVSKRGGGQVMAPPKSQIVLADALGSDPGQVFPMRSELPVGVPAARGQIRGRGAGDGGAFTGENLLGKGREGPDSHRSSGPTWLPGGVENSPRHLSRRPPRVGTPPRRPTLPCKVGHAPQGAAVGAALSWHRDLGTMRDVLGGTLWDSPAWEQVLWGRDTGWHWGAAFCC